MKKERPAHTLSALVGASEAETVRQAIFTQTTTLGVWENWVAKVAKRALDREVRTVAVDGRPVRVKVGRLPDGTVVTAQPEGTTWPVAADLARSGKLVLAHARRKPPSPRTTQRRWPAVHPSKTWFTPPRRVGSRLGPMGPRAGPAYHSGRID